MSPLFHFFFRWKFFRPPADMVNSVRQSSPVKVLFLIPEIRVIRFQNASGNIVAPGTAEGKESFSVNFKHLTTHQMDDRRSDFMHLTPVPFFDRISIQSVKILVISVHKQCGKGLALQPVQNMFLFFTFSARIPYTAKIPADDYEIVLRHFFLLREYAGAESLEILMAIACNINHSGQYPRSSSIRII